MSPVSVLDQSVEKLHEVFERTDIETELKKIEQKLEEAHYNPGDVTPIVDCIFSLFLAARSRGYKVSAVLEELNRVAAKNLERRWKKMPDGTYRAM
jgi:hypothetical protein